MYISVPQKRGKCDRYRTKDILNGPYEKIEGTFDFWDPNLFVDDDGKVYFYWGCSNETPMWGVELDPQTMNQRERKKNMIYADPYKYGYERIGDDNGKLPRSKEEVDACFDNFMKSQGTPVEQIPANVYPDDQGNVHR